MGKASLVLVVLTCHLVGAATQFEAVSIKPSAPAVGEPRSSFQVSATRLTITHAPLTGLIRWAYDLGREEIQGGAGWMTSMDSAWDVRATTSGPVSTDEMRRLLQTLLAERFRLQVHRETKDGPAYLVQIAKGGPKLHEVERGADERGQVLYSQSGPMAILTGTKARMPDLVPWLGSLTMSAGLPVIDSTGLKSAGDFRIQWPREEDGSLTPLFEALEQQLGLKMEVGKAAIEVMILDRAARPTPDQ